MQATAMFTSMVLAVGLAGPAWCADTPAGKVAERYADQLSEPWTSAEIRACD